MQPFLARTLIPEHEVASGRLLAHFPAIRHVEAIVDEPFERLVQPEYQVSLQTADRTQTTHEPGW